MKDPYLYILESIVCSGFFLVVYRLLIMRSTGFRANRLFLLLAMIGACAIPWLQIPVWTVQEPIIHLSLQGEVEGTSEVVSATTNVPWGVVIYALGVGIMLVRMFLPLFRTMTLKRRSEVVLRGSYFLVISQKIQDAFSSFRTIYLPMMDDKEEERMVIAHEESHLRHFHIFERWAMELLKAFCWFNPFVWMASRYLVESQKMEVDADVLHQGFDMTEYREMLLKYAMGGEPEWICAFSSHSMKRRLLAMTEHRKIQNLRFWLIVPMLVLALACFGFTVKPVSLENEEVTEEMITLEGRVVDAETQKPIFGSIVIEAESTNGTLTDINGKFKFKIQKNKKLKFLMVDYEIQMFQADELIGKPLKIELVKTKK